MRIHWSLLGLMILALVGCPSGDDDDGGPGDDDAADDDDAGDDDAQADPETDCFDDEDNDHDGLVDCADSDCASEFECTWPGQMQHTARFEFYSDVAWLDDCETRFESHMVHTTAGDVCPHCDRTYEGQYQYSVNTCAEILELGGVDLPQEGMSGIVFIDENQREVHTRNTDGIWEAVGVATRDAQVGHYILERHDDVETFGALVTALTFTDL